MVDTNTASVKSPIPGANVMLMGETGSGKTTVLRTLPDAGVETFIIFTEPHGMAVVADIPCPKLHWTYIPPTSSSWEDLLKRADTMSKMSWSALSKMTEDPDKHKYRGYWKVVDALHNFKCDRCGKEFGDVSNWGTNRAIVIDSFSGINQMAMQLITGESIARSQPQWGAAQVAEITLSNRLCYDTRAHFILITHIERLLDEISGGMTLVPLALGKKVAPELPKNFSDVIHCYRSGLDFRWSTATPNAALKGGNCPLSDKLPASFVPLIEKWKSRGGIIETTNA